MMLKPLLKTPVMRRLAWLGVSLLLGASGEAGEIVVSPDRDGVAIEAVGAGRFVLAAPVLSMHEEDYEGQKPQLALEGDVLTARYECGAELTIRVNSEEATADYEFSGVPKTAKGFRFQMLIPLSFNEGGRFAFGDKPPAKIPAAQKEQFLEQGIASRFTIVNGQGAGFTLTAPENWQGLQDNRVFNWQTYAWLYLYDFKKYSGRNDFSMRFQAAMD